jgi:dTDP-4-amino-4,6-dideoxygalactose transaminase
MLGKLKFILKLLSGNITPFLMPFWDKSEPGVLQKWLRNEIDLTGSIQKLEETLKRHYGGNHIVRTLNRGRSAIQVALESMNLPRGSEVLLPTFSCTGLIMPVVQAGFNPVLVDVDRNFHISFKSVQEAYTQKVKAIILPHLWGCWANDAENIMSWAKTRKIFVIEDCAQSLDLIYKGKLAGTFGDAGIFSCCGGKQIVNSGGAWVITADKKLREFIKNYPLNYEPQEEVKKRVLEFYTKYTGSKIKYGISLLCEVLENRLMPVNKTKYAISHYSYKVHALSDVEANVISLQMDKISSINEKRKKNACYIMNKFKELNLRSLHLLPETNNVFTKMLVSFEGVNLIGKVKLFRRILRWNGIETENTYIPLHLREPFKIYRKTSMETAEALWKSAFCIPIRPDLVRQDFERYDSAFNDLRRVNAGL